MMRLFQRQQRYRRYSYTPDTKLSLARIKAGLPFRFTGSKEALADTSGTAILDIGAPTIGWQWLIERMNVNGSGIVVVYVGGMDASNEVDLSDGPHNIADESSAIQVFQGQSLRIIFTGADVGARCVATYQGVQYSD